MPKMDSFLIKAKEKVKEKDKKNNAKVVDFENKNESIDNTNVNSNDNSIVDSNETKNDNLSVVQRMISLQKNGFVNDVSNASSNGELINKGISNFYSKKEKNKKIKEKIYSNIREKYSLNYSATANTMGFFMMLRDLELPLKTCLEIDSLEGAQKDVFVFILEFCKKYKTNKTGPIKTYALSEAVDRPESIVKMAIHRLTEKGLIKRVNGKKGRGGYLSLSIKKKIFEELIKKSDYFA